MTVIWHCGESRYYRAHSCCTLAEY